MDTQGRATARGRARGGRASRGPPSQAEGGGMRRPGEGISAPPQQRARAPPSAAPSYAQMGAQGGPRPQQPPPQSAWGPPPSGRASRQTGDVAGVSAQMQQVSLRDAPSSTGGSVGSGSASGSGPVEGGNGAASVGRGALRGRRVIPETAVHTRPAHVVSKQGTSGAKQQLKANYFKLETVTDWCLYQYRVDFAPEEDRTKIRKGLLGHHRETLGGYIFDGTMMFTSHRLVPDPMTLTSQRTEDGVNFTITVKLVGDLAKGDYQYVQFFNIIMRKCLETLKLQLVGRDYYDAEAKQEVREFKLELWPGYKTSIRQHETDILMCAEVTFKVMRQETVFQVLQSSYERDRNNWKRTFMEAVVGCVVLTDYNNKTYRVDDVDFDSNPLKTFKKKTGEEISYAQYYSDRYQIRIRDNTQPMLVSRAKARDVRAGMSETIYLIPELCRMTGLTDDMRNNFHLMKALAVHTRVAPDARMNKLMDFSRRLRSSEECTRDLQKWNLRLGENLVSVPGRELPVEKILVGNGGTQMPDDRFDWSAAFRNKPMLSIQALNKWVVVVPQRMMQDCKSFVDTLSRVASGMRFTLAQPMVKEIPDDRAGTYVQALTQILDQHLPQLIMCAVPNNRGDRYSAIKKKCCVDRAVPTQVIVGKNLTSKGVMSIASKVAIQMNCKIGGSPWSVEVPLNGLMVVGFDVCHDTANKSQSYGAMVASLDKPMSRYFSAVSAHQSGEELSNDLSLNIVKALHKFKAMHNKLPERIFVYRDGVGEGQLPQVFNHEVELVKQRLAEAYSGQQPRLSYIIVTKRINTRIFANPRTPLKGNPRSGTVVDDVITDPTKYDFYIVSQSVNQGTVAPTSYNVLHDTSGMDADKIQRLTYKLCHMYFNWSGTVRVPAPCQYAHKLAFLVGQSLHREPSRGLEDLLYFL